MYIPVPPSVQFKTPPQPLRPLTLDSFSFPETETLLLPKGWAQWRSLSLSLRVLQASTGCAPSPLGALTRRPSEYSLEEQLVVLGLELAQLYLQLGALAGRII